MNNFILCSFCGNLVAYNSSFSGYECSNCGAFTPKQDCKEDKSYDVFLEVEMDAEFYKDCFILMDAWNKMKNITKTNICSICIPFRDKYKLTDLQTLMIARGEMKASQILEIGKNLENK